MILLVLLLVPVSFVLSWLACGVVLRVSVRAGAFDTAAMPGQVKEAARRVPNTGGIGLVWTVLGVLGVGLLLVGSGAGLGGGDRGLLEPIREHLDGMRSVVGLGWAVVIGGVWLHGLGLVDDRRPLGPMFKLVCMALPAVVLAVFFDTRLLTALDGVAGGRWLSVLVTVLWFVGVTNAMNFIDNMDGLCGGVSAVAGAMFLAAVLLGGQWFVGAVLALLVGACAGFLVWNRPPARIFLGDGGSLVIGYLLAFTTVRTTYLGADAGADVGADVGSGAWYAVLMPLVVLAVPLYDMASVTAIRLSQGRSPFVGDLQHFSHRLVARGLSKRSAVAVIVALTGATGISGLLLMGANAWQAAAIGGQVALLLVVLAVFEHRSSGGGRGDAG